MGQPGTFLEILTMVPLMERTTTAAAVLGEGVLPLDAPTSAL